MGIICRRCGRDIDAIEQDNMGLDIGAPLCESCDGGDTTYSRRAVKRRRLAEEHFFGEDEGGE